MAENKSNQMPAYELRLVQGIGKNSGKPYYAVQAIFYDTINGAPYKVMAFLKPLEVIAVNPCLPYFEPINGNK